MIRRFVSLVPLLSIAFGTAKAETLTASVPMSTANENPPITAYNATGGFLITINVTRDAAGAVTAGTINFTGTFGFPGAITVTGLHIHEGAAPINGPVRFDTGLSATNSRDF